MASAPFPPDLGARPGKDRSVEERLAWRLRQLLDAAIRRRANLLRRPAVCAFLSEAWPRWAELWTEAATELHAAKLRRALRPGWAGVAEALAEPVLLPEVEDQLLTLEEERGDDIEEELPTAEEVLRFVGRVWYRGLVRLNYLKPPAPRADEAEEENSDSESDLESESESEAESENEGEPEEDEEEEEDLEDGACLICERITPLTRHHTIPRQVHRQFAKQGFSRERLHSTIAICRPCHSAVHKLAPNKELAAKYHSLELILAHPKMPAWVKYIRTRRVYTKSDSVSRHVAYHR